jgi:hypothetical protein
VLTHCHCENGSAVEYGELEAVHDLSLAEPRRDAEVVGEVGTDQSRGLAGVPEQSAEEKKGTSDFDDEWMDKAKHAGRVQTVSGDAKLL